MVLGFVVNFPGVTHFWMEPFVGYGGDRDAVSWDSQTAADETGMTLNAQAVVIEANNIFSTVASNSQDSHARLAWGKIAVLSYSDNEWVQRLEYLLAEEMSHLAGVEQVGYYADGILPEGTVRPDVFISLDLEYFKENRLPYRRELEARIRVNADTLPWEPKSHTFDGRSVPQVMFGVKSTLDHKSTTRGFETHKYQMALQNICKQIMESWQTHLDKWREEYGIIPELPEYFYGEGLPFELPGEFAVFEPEVMFSGPGLWRHQEAFWRGMIDGERKLEIYEQLKASLQEQGWASDAIETFSEDSHYLRFRQDDRILEIYQPDETAARSVLFEKQALTTRPELVCVYYQHRFSMKEVETVLDEMLNAEPTMEMLTLLQRSFSRRQSKQVVSLLEKNPQRSWAGQVMLVDMLRRSGDTERAREALRRAAVHCWFEKSDRPDRNQIKKLVEDMNGEPIDLEVPDVALMREMGIREISAVTEPFEVETGLGEPVEMFYFNAEGEFYTVMTRVIRQHKEGESFYTLEQVKHLGGGSVSSYYGKMGIDDTNGILSSNFTTMGTDDLSIHCDVIRLDDTPRFKLSFSVEKH